MERMLEVMSQENYPFFLAISFSRHLSYLMDESIRDGIEEAEKHSFARSLLTVMELKSARFLEMLKEPRKEHEQ